MQHFKSKDLSNGCGALSEAEILASVGHVVNYPNTPIHPDTFMCIKTQMLLGC